MEDSNIRTNVLPRGSIIGSSINMKSCSTCLSGKKGYIFIVSFLSLFIFFLQDEYKTKNNISLEFQFKYNISRRLAEAKEGEGNKSEGSTLDLSEVLSSLNEVETSGENSGETVSYSEFLPRWNRHLELLEEFLQDFSTDLFHKFVEFASSHRIDSADKNEFCSRVLGKINDSADGLKASFEKRLNDLFIDGSCTKEECERLLRNSRHLWGKFKDHSLKYFKENLERLYYNTD